MQDDESKLVSERLVETNLVAHMVILMKRNESKKYRRSRKPTSIAQMYDFLFEIFSEQQYTHICFHFHVYSNERIQYADERQHQIPWNVKSI